MEGEVIARQAELWIGTPVRQGSQRGVGCDCKGLVAGVFRELGLPEADSFEAACGDYGDIIPVARLKAGLRRLFDAVRPADRQPGDVLLVRVNGVAQHLAIFAPLPDRRARTIEAMCTAPLQVRPFRRRDDEIESVWRRKEEEESLSCDAASGASSSPLFPAEPERLRAPGRACDDAGRVTGAEVK